MINLLMAAMIMGCHKIGVAVHGRSLSPGLGSEKEPFALYDVIRVGNELGSSSRPGPAPTSEGPV